MAKRVRECFFNWQHQTVWSAARILPGWPMTGRAEAGGHEAAGRAGISPRYRTGGIEERDFIPEAWPHASDDATRVQRDKFH